MTEDYELVNEQPIGTLALSIASVVSYDEQALTVKPLDSTPYGVPVGPAFASTGFVGISDLVLDGRIVVRQDWLWLKVGDPVLNEDETQCYPILERHGNANVKADAIAVYVSG